MFTLTLKPRGSSLQTFMAKFKNDAEPLMGAPWREMLEDVGQDAEGIAKSDAPRASGKLASSIRSRVAKSVRPKWVKVEETATRSSRRYKRYPYPRRLEYDPRRGHQGWFTRPLERATPTFEGKMRRFGGKVRERWGS
jgi:hypothetical protein